MENLMYLKSGKILYVLPRDRFSYYVPFAPKILYGFLKIKSGDYVVDAGAAYGDFTIYASLLAGQQGKVISIEPNPYSFAILKMNVEANRLQNTVTLVNKAVSDHVGKARLTGSGYGAHLSNAEGMEIETTTLDRLLQDLNLTRIDVVKMDIEGQEVAALKGFEQINEVREIVIETHDTFSFHYVKEHLFKSGFNIYILNNSLLARNIVRNLIPNIADLILAETRTRFLALSSLSKYLLGVEDHPVPPCRPSPLRIVYGTKKR